MTRRNSGDTSLTAFDEEYQYEILSRPEDAKNMAEDIAQSFAKNNAVLRALNIGYEDYHTIMLDELLSAGINDQMSVFCRHKPTGQIVSGTVNVRRDSVFDCKTTAATDDFLEFLETQKSKLDFDAVEKSIGSPVAQGDIIYVRDDHLGRGLGKNMVIMELHALRQMGIKGFHVAIVSALSYKNLVEVIVEDGEFARTEIKYSEYVTPDGRRPLAQVPGTFLGCIVTTKLKPHYEQWAMKQPLIGLPESFRGGRSGPISAGKTTTTTTMRTNMGSTSVNSVLNSLGANANVTRKPAVTFASSAVKLIKRLC